MEVLIRQPSDPAGDRQDACLFDGPDTFQCERCTGTFPTHLRRLCVSCKFSCCNDCCREDWQPNSGPGAQRGDGSASDAKKAKCKSFRLEPEPEPAQLRRWIVEMKERVANAFAYDPAYALAWVEIPDGARYEDLADECKYGMLENECNSVRSVTA